MIYFFTPYAFNRKLFDAWDQYMELVPDPQDWVCMMDGDIAFFRNDFGHHIEKYTQKYPDVSIFSCYASRSGTPWMMPTNHQFDSRNIIVHRKLAEDCAINHKLELEVLNRRVTGHMMLMRKSTWVQFRDKIKEASASRDLYGIDTIICKQVLLGGGSICLMKGIYVFHYYRHMEGSNNKSHLL
ncbi:MAG: hypothetical protein WCK18_18930 [Prolixibacteraceae bacterium]